MTATPEGLLDRLYQRLGTRYLALVLVTMIVIAFAGFAVTVLVDFRYESRSLNGAVQTIALGIGCYVVLGSAVFPMMWRDLKPLVGWIRAGRPRDGAPAPWHVTVGVTPRWMPRVYVLASFGALPALVYEAAHLHLGVAFVAVGWFVGQLGLSATCVVLLFSAQALSRPLVKDAAAARGPISEVPRSRLGVRPKLILALTVTTAFTALVVAAVVGPSGSGIDRALLALAVAVGLTLVLSAPAIRWVTDSVVEPVQELGAAAERVAAGDVGTPVPVSTTDELGVLAGRFNQMLAGLQERERLRDDVRRHAAELRESRARIVAASDAARQHVERDLHDGAQQQLVLVNLKLGLAERALERDPATGALLLAELRADLDRALSELRDLAHGIYPAQLENEGLPGALRDAVERSAIPVALECDGAGRYRPELEAAVYFCCLEALQNAAKHAGEGARATLRLGEQDHALRFEVADDGRGYDPVTARASRGLQNMTDRIGAVGGSLRIESAPGMGTTVNGTIPLGS